MQPVIAWVVVAVSLGLTVVGAAVSGLNRLPGRVLLGVCVVTEIAVLVQSEVAGVRLAGGTRPEHTGTVIGYLLGIALVLPIALVYALGERTRWSGLIIGVGGVTVTVMTFRLLTLWPVSHV